MFLFNSIMLSSIVSVAVFTVTLSPSTVKFPLTLRSPTDGSSNNPVSPSRVIKVVVTPPSFTVNIMSLSCVVCAIVRLSLAIVNVMSEPAPSVSDAPSTSTPSVPEVVSLALDLR